MSSPDGYGTHADYMARVQAEAEARRASVEDALRRAFGAAIRRREVDVVFFEDLSIDAIAEAFVRFPAVLKPLLVACNIAARGIERDLGIKNLDTYGPRLSKDQALTITGYLKPYLPPYLEIPVLLAMDAAEYIDKEIRKGKGQWERDVRTALNTLSSTAFKKRQFEWQGEVYELDAAAPATGVIEYAVDIKRIEARRDIHKRSDEIVNKADRFVRAFPEGKFGAIIYYPFVTEHANVQDRLRSDHITSVVFASESDESITNAVKLLLAKFGVPRKT